MDLDVPTAIHAQLLTLPPAERDAALARLIQLADDPQRMASAVRKSRSDEKLWTVRLSGRLRALVRVDGDRLHVLAIAPIDQLIPYLDAGGKRVA